MVEISVLQSHDSKHKIYLSFFFSDHPHHAEGMLNIMPPTNLPLHVLTTTLPTMAPQSIGTLTTIPTTPHGPLQEVIQISTTTPQIPITTLTIILHIVSPRPLHLHICEGRILTSPLLVVKLTMAPHVDSGRIMKTNIQLKHHGRERSPREAGICLAEIEEILWTPLHCMEEEVRVVRGVWPWIRLPTERS